MKNECQLRVLKYCLKHAWQHRAALTASYRRTRLRQVTRLSIASLKERNVTVCVLDFDGVLASHAKIDIDSEVRAWLRALLARFQGEVCILSNQPRDERIQYVQQEFPQIHFITGVEKKPFPDGLEKVAQSLQVSLEQIILVDDRLLTGVLASVIAGTQVIWITHPLRDFRYAFWAELYFSGLRFLERCFVRMLCLFS